MSEIVILPLGSGLQVDSFFFGEGLQDFRRRVLTYAKPKWM